MPDQSELILSRLARLDETLELVANNVTIQTERLEAFLHLAQDIHARVSELTQTRRENDR